MNNRWLKQMLCTNCKKIITINNQNKYYIGILLNAFLFGAVIFVGDEDSFDFSTKVYGIIITLAIYLSAMFVLNYFYKKYEICTECNGNKILIAIDSPEAIKIIQENNLEIPDLNTEKKFPWQTS